MSYHRAIPTCSPFSSAANTNGMALTEKHGCRSRSLCEGCGLTSADLSVPLLVFVRVRRRTGLPNELRRSFAMFDADRSGYMHLTAFFH